MTPKVLDMALPMQRTCRKRNRQPDRHVLRADIIRKQYSFGLKPKQPITMKQGMSAIVCLSPFMEVDYIWKTSVLKSCS